MVTWNWVLNNLVLGKITTNLMCLYLTVIDSQNTTCIPNMPNKTFKSQLIQQSRNAVLV